MENEYKFVSKFVDGKTLKELTEEEIEKIKSGVGVKKEDKEYMESLEKAESELKEDNNEETVNQVEKLTDNVIENEKIQEPQESNSIEDTIKESGKVNKNGVRVIQAIGKTLKLEDTRTVILSKEELKEKTFWRKGDVYYG